MIKANDTDVLVLALSVFAGLQEAGLQQMWVAFGQGQNIRWISVHDIFQYVDQEKVKGMLFFHAFTGCDTVSAFRNKGKKPAWQTWDICPEASPVFSKLGTYPPTVDDCDLKILKKFVILIYDRSSTAATVRPGLTCSPESRGLKSHSHQPEQLCSNTLGMLPIRLVVCGPRQPSVSQKQRTLQTGDGRRLVRNGRSSGQPTLQ